jgi:hypothetical protein
MSLINQDRISPIKKCDLDYFNGIRNKEYLGNYQSKLTVIL